MQVVTLSLVIVTALGSIGMALWTWRAMANIGEGSSDFAGFDDLHFHDRSDRS